MQLSDDLLRSILRVGQEPEADLISNFVSLRNEIEPDGIDLEILQLITSLFDRANQIPTHALLHQHFEKLQDDGHGSGLPGVGRLDQLLLFAVPFISGADFRWALDQYRLEVLREEVARTVTEATAVLNAGRQSYVKGKGQVLIQGPEAAYEALSEGVSRIAQRVKTVSSEGSLKADAAAALREYEERRLNPGLQQGVLSGLDDFDLVHRGVRPGDLAFVLGFTGHMKTTFVMNWAYQAAIEQGRNVAVLSTEMTYSDLRALLYVIHAGHKKFLGRPGHLEITYDKVLWGQLDPQQTLLYQQAVDDFARNPAHGEIFIRHPRGQVTVADAFRWAHERDRAKPLSLFVIDYIGQVDAAVDKFSLETMANINMAIRQTKDQAVSFGQGRGIGVLTPFQSNRDGVKEAEKNGGRYSLRAFSNANEAERSADLVYSVYLDEASRSMNELIMGNLKTRKVPLVTELVTVYADPRTKRIENGNQTGAAAGGANAGLI